MKSFLSSLFFYIKNHIRSLSFAVLLILFIAGIASLLLGYLPFSFINKPSENTSLVQKIAHDMVETCQRTGEYCYSNEFAKLTRVEDLKIVLSVLQEVNKIDPGSRGCHLMAHSISTETTLKDIDHWEEVLIKLPTEKCTGGFLHGVFEARQLEDPTLEINAMTIPKICKIVNNKSIGSSMQNCSHIMGHLLVVVKNGDLTKASEECGKLPNQIQYECQSGVFMENETRDGIVDHGIGKRIPWNEETTRAQQKLCENTSGIATKACWREISHMYVFISKDYPLDVFELCSQSGNEDATDECYQHGVGIMTASSGFNPDNMKLLCQPYEGNDEKFASCVSMGIGSMMASSLQFVDRVINLCKTIPYRFTEGCYERMIQKLARIAPAEELKIYCEDVPYPFQKRCEHPYL